MAMTKKRIVLLHVLAWLAYLAYCFVGILYFSGNEISFPKVSLLLQLSYLLSLMSVFYYYYSLILPGFFNRKLRFVAVLGALATPFVFIFTRYLLEEKLYDLLFGFHNYSNDTTFKHYMLDNLYRGLPAIIFSSAAWGLTYAYRQERENKQLREEKIKAELAFLKSQINPHFLYNTLNYIYSLAYPVSDKLADAIIKLSQLMRYMLTESPDGLIDLEKEVDYLNNYIDIYRLRFEDNFHVDFKVEGDIAGKRLASLVLIPFVENAFKHGAVDDPQRPVRIHLKAIANRLMFTVSNKISHHQKDHSSGVGLVNIRRRLELIYPGKHDLLISENGQTYKTTLNIEL
ncbi:sensor histidine kinase [Mucilaginibacter terrae]|uniref:Two-component system LytT family sensor kinase n=1 Tax=Mucilaginibacter terrae TaxID=1955052 RepID=A0ABU3GU83_9SPHI|nr:histidine kinase [Mucilaginibacter terrae]MDT3403332.1 two-component system LytT family sensor kinase [Mucilaginibacter terrae]